jgi:multicomponent Na+:H+ antiporter subunit B
MEFNLILFLIITILSVFSISLILIQNIFIITLITAFISFFLSILYMILTALDVAFTEIAIGAGISTALFLIVIRLSNQYNYFANPINTSSNIGQYKKILTLSVLFIFAIILGISFIDLPLFGDILNPSNNFLYKDYIESTNSVFNVPNAVTIILGSFRGFDTLGETAVIAIAAIGVYSVLLNEDETKDKPLYSSVLSRNYILNSAIFSLFPFLLLYAIYVQFHGDFGPGGGFQAGVIFAAPYILLIIMNNNSKYSAFSVNKLLSLLGVGVLIYSATGFLSVFLGGNFLDFYYFGNNFEHSYHYGLFFIELGVGITVFAAMLSIIMNFYKQLNT